MPNSTDNVVTRPRVFLGDLATGTLEIFYPDITTNGATRVENSDAVAREASARLEHIKRGKGARVQALHPSIAEGEFDPAHIDPATVEDIKNRMTEILDESNLYAAARARVGMTRDDFLEGMLNRGELSPLWTQDGQLDWESMRWLINQTDFGRQDREYYYLRDMVLPGLADREIIRTANFGPGYDVPMTLIASQPYYTIEPFMLASLSRKMKIQVYDFSPESIQALKVFDGHLLMRSVWRYAEGVIPPSVEKMFRENIGPNWREIFAKRKELFDTFLKATGGHLVENLTLGKGGPAVVHIYLPPQSYQGIERPKQTVDITIDPLEGGWDLVYFHMHEWLKELATATLFRVVDRLSDGAYFVTEPYVDGTILGGERRYYHSPPPVLMAAMGLEAVADLRAENCLSIIFRKVGPSNEFVREGAAHVERILERARNGTPPQSGSSSRGGTHHRGGPLPHQFHSRGLGPQALAAGALNVLTSEVAADFVADVL